MNLALRSLISRRLPTGTLVSSYIRVRTIKAFGLIALALTGLFSLLEFVEQLASVGDGNFHVWNALAYVVLTIPGRLLQVTPASMLLGSLLSLSALARSSELTAMQSVGIAESTIVRPVLELTLPLVAILFLIAQFVVPPAELLADKQRSDALYPADSPPPTISLWAASDRTYLNVARFGKRERPVGIEIYSFKPDGSLAEIIHADMGAAGPDGTWLLSGVSRKHMVQGQLETENLAHLPWKSFISPKQMRFLSLPLDSVPPIALFAHLRKLKKIHVRAPRFEHELWAKLSIPVSMVAMILVTSRLVFGPARTHSIASDLAWGVGFVLVFSLAQQIVGSAGILLNLPPALCSLTLPLLVIVYTVPKLYSFAWLPKLTLTPQLRRVRV
jgi:lipopolysaccharide export system permease protein